MNKEELQELLNRFNENQEDPDITEENKTLLTNIMNVETEIFELTTSTEEKLKLLFEQSQVVLNAFLTANK